MLKKLFQKLPTLGLRQVRRLVIFMVGMTVLLLGVLMVVLPGPAVLVIPAGLAILAIEFQWAKRWLDQAKDAFHRVTRRPKAPEDRKTQVSTLPRGTEPTA